METTYRRAADVDVADATLLEGLPGRGLVASIAIDEITDQLELAHHGSVRSDEFPPVVTYESDRLVDAVSVFAAESPPVVILQSDIPVTPFAVRSAGRCLLDEFGPRLERAIFLVAIPARSSDHVGAVSGIASTDEVRDQLSNVGIAAAAGEGVLSGPPAALAREVYHADVPVGVLLVETEMDPFVPDPAATKAVVDRALEPLVGFDVDTEQLEARAEQIRTEKQDLADRYQSMTESADEDALSSMYW